MKFSYVLAAIGVAMALNAGSAKASNGYHYLQLHSNEFRGIQLDLQIAVGYPDPVEKHTNWCSRMAIFPDTTQGGPWRILSLDAHAQRANNSCFRDIEVPADGAYKLWVRYDDWRNKTEFFKIRVEQAGKTKADHEFGAKPVIDDNDELKLRVDFAYAWDSMEVPLQRGPARITLYTDRVAEADRDIDNIILTDDSKYVPQDRGAITPDYGAYLDAWRQSYRSFAPLVPASSTYSIPSAWRIPKIAGRDFWYSGMQIDDIKEWNDPAFPVNSYKKATDSEAPEVMSDPATALWTRLGSEQWPDAFKPDSPFYKYVKSSKRPFWIESTWPGFHHPQAGIDYVKVYNAMKAEFGEQYLGFYELEGPFLPQNTIAPDTPREAAYTAAVNFIKKNMADNVWKKIFNADVGPMLSDYFPTPSFTAPEMMPVFAELGMKFIGNELGDGATDQPLRQAFNRGAARQYGAKWGSHYGAFAYESGPPNDTDTGYGDWLTGRSGDLYGGSISVMRRTAYMMWLMGANAHHFEDVRNIYWQHWHHAEKKTLNPRGEAVAQFLRDVKTHDRGVPYTPIAFLMDTAHGWTNSSLTPYRIWNNLLPQQGDYAVDQHFESLSWPVRRDEMLIHNDEQAQMPHSIIGDIYDVLFTSDTHMDAVDNYRVVWLVGDTRLKPNWVAKLRQFVLNGGTLITNVEQARNVFDTATLGATLTGKFDSDTVAKCGLENEMLRSSEFDYELVTPTTAKVITASGKGAPLITQNSIGKGQVILTTPRWMMTRDGWALPLQPHLALHVASGLLPVAVGGNVEYTINRTANGWLVGLMNNRGVYKMAHAQAVVNRDEVAPVEISHKGKLFKQLVVQPGAVELVPVPE